MQMMTHQAARVFELHIRCESCLRDTVRDLPVPEVACAPADVDDLMESGWLDSLTFCCSRCEGVIGRLFAVNIREEVARSAA